MDENCERIESSLYYHKKYFPTFFSLNPSILEHWKNFSIFKEFKGEKNYCYHTQWEMTLVIKALGAMSKECK